MNPVRTCIGCRERDDRDGVRRDQVRDQRQAEPAPAREHQRRDARGGRAEQQARAEHELGVLVLAEVGQAQAVDLHQPERSRSTLSTSASPSRIPASLSSGVMDWQGRWPRDR